MFQIVRTVKGDHIVVTDNPSIAASIISEEYGPDTPIFFTGASDQSTAAALACDLRELTSRSCRVEKRSKHPVGWSPWVVTFVPKADAPEQCPITLAEILQASFTPMVENDYDGFAGIQGTGYIADVKNCVVVYDAGADTDECPIQVRHRDSSRSWGFKISREAVRL